MIFVDYSKLMKGGSDEDIANKKELYHDIILKNGCQGIDHLAVFFSKLYLEGMNAFSFHMKEFEKVEWLRDLIEHGFLTDAIMGNPVTPLRDVKNPSAFTKMLHSINPKMYPYIYDSHIREALGFKSDTVKARDAYEELNVNTRPKVEKLSEKEIYLLETKSWREKKLYM